jgi:N6-L-threonylcarbamoyladenine synthase
MSKSKSVKLLAIESSADETGAAVLDGDRKSKKFRLLSNVIFTQMAIHRKTGGIVPEVAARSHITKILPVIRQALAKAGVRLRDLDAIAVTSGPGLITSLMVGVDTAKALSWALQIPIVPVNHHEGHLLSALGAQNSKVKTQRSKLKFPAVGLVVSGGHTLLVLAKKIGRYKIIGQTLDDAAGECFDKVAKILGLAYPGGPEISRLAKQGDPRAMNFPRPMIDSNNFNFSFSGLKTAVLYFVRDHKLKAISNKLKADICASVEQAIVDVLVAKTIRAAKTDNAKTILLGGGVSANAKLRSELQSAVRQQLPTSDLRLPTSALTADNAGMIAIVGWFKYLAGKTQSLYNIGADPNLIIKSWT